MDTREFGNVIIHRKDNSTGGEAILYAHGSFDKGSKVVALPGKVAMYFYSFHGSASTDHAVKSLTKTGKPADTDNENGLVEFSEAKTFLRMGSGKVISIAGCGAEVRNYNLSYNEKSLPHLDSIKTAWESGLHNHDLILVKEGASIKLADVFKVITENNLEYNKVHFTACRSPSRGNDFDQQKPYPY
ncbi:putative adhesin [Microbulbifer sp. ZKSA004]|uniref:putative adhesin n=1 Tax=Microbulbifer sp. ZKSA004 TaxID=3243389 RepID=UPI004039797A